MSRSTIKQQNMLLDEIKDQAGLSSRNKAGEFLYSTIAPSFRSRGYNLSHYKDGCFQLTKDNMRYFSVSCDQLFTPFMTTQELDGKQ